MYTTDLKRRSELSDASVGGVSPVITERALVRVIVVFSKSLWDIFFNRRKVLLEERGCSGDGDSGGGMPARGRGTGGSVVEGGTSIHTSDATCMGKTGAC